MSTIKEVAQRANVSVTTVSRVINNNGYVHKDTKEIINKAILELNYLPNSTIEEISKSYENIGIITSEITSTVKSKLIDVLQEKLKKKNYRGILAITRNSSFLEQYYLDLFERENVCGLIILDNINSINNFIEIKKPVISVGFTINNSYNSVNIDYTKASSEVVDEIELNNCKNVLIIKYKADLEYKYASILSELSSKKTDYSILDISKNYDKIKLQEYLNTNRFDSIYTTSDFLSINVLSILNNLKINVPNDCIVIGFDNSPFSTLTSPMLTTIDYPVDSIGTAATELLCTTMESNYIGDDVILNAELIRRESTKRDA